MNGRCKAGGSKNTDREAGRAIYLTKATKMTTKVILYFPSDATDKAVTYDLVKRYDLRINILRAEIEAGRSGSLLVELTGEEPMVREGIAYLEGCGVTVSPVASKIAYDRERCIDCGNCALACSTGALDRRTRLETPFRPRTVHRLQTLPEELSAGAVPYRIYRGLSGVRRTPVSLAHGRRDGSFHGMLP